ncbi:PREDICTED: uncharacterized protein LOC109175357 [Ipomoea nil]|uniref:uncharacterized protein LOC109175357 n=1 Tax=Ipomoea nil TaxID=35883 RepID=UPI0009014FD2|nr:PREDICTED: uncharacterized protein LOC109175357 [Ipomoea nil]
MEKIIEKRIYDKVAEKIRKETMEVDLDEAIFHHQDVDFIHVLFQDIKDLLTMRWLDVTILQIFIICLSRMCSKIGVHTIGFLCPRTICADSVLADIDKVTKYLVNAMVEQTNRHFILAPYHEKAFRSVETLGGRRPKNNVDWVHIECPQQPGGVECGYYVMRFMYEICTQCWDSDDLDMELFFNRKPYSEAQIDEVREIWSKYFTQKCI